MSTLRKINRPLIIIIASVILVSTLLFLDTKRKPEKQATSAAYIYFVEIYQANISPLMADYVNCRYIPTCSDYSIEAVQKHGFPEGVKLSVKRISSCQPDVPKGTHDPVPEP